MWDYYAIGKIIDIISGLIRRFKMCKELSKTYDRYYMLKVMVDMNCDFDTINGREFDSLANDIRDMYDQLADIYHDEAIKAHSLLPDKYWMEHGRLLV